MYSYNFVMSSFHSALGSFNVFFLFDYGLIFVRSENSVMHSSHYVLYLRALCICYLNVLFLCVLRIGLFYVLFLCAVLKEEYKIKKEEITSGISTLTTNLSSGTWLSLRQLTATVGCSYHCNALAKIKHLQSWHAFERVFIHVVFPEE